MKTFLFDGQRYFHNYYWNRKGEIVNKKTTRKLKGTINSYGLRVVSLVSDQGKTIIRSFNKLKKFSYKKKYLPKNYDKYIDVFGHEGMYCFDPDDPTKVFSKSNLAFKKILTNNDGYKFIRVGKGTLYLHIMVVESHYKMKVDFDKYEVHHLHGKENNKINDLILLTKEDHKKIHKQMKGSNNDKK